MALDTERLIAELRAYENEPMWADHAEVPKKLLKIAADEIMALHVAYTVCVDGGTHDMVCAERDRLREALTPFAGLPETSEAETDVPNDSPVTIRCQLGDMRRAYVALHPSR